MDRAMRTSENIMYNEVGKEGREVTGHIKTFSLHSKSKLKKKKKKKNGLKQKQNL